MVACGRLDPVDAVARNDAGAFASFLNFFVLAAFPAVLGNVTAACINVTFCAHNCSPQKSLRGPYVEMTKGIFSKTLSQRGLRVQHYFTSDRVEPMISIAQGS